MCWCTPNKRTPWCEGCKKVRPDLASIRQKIIDDARKLPAPAMRDALVAAKAEIEWWAREHGCCDGHQDEVLATIEAALR